MHTLAALLRQPCCDALQELSVSGVRGDLLMLTASLPVTLQRLSLRITTPLLNTHVCELVMALRLPHLTELDLFVEKEEASVEEYDWRQLRPLSGLRSLSICIPEGSQRVHLPPMPRLEHLSLGDTSHFEWSAELVASLTALTSLELGSLRHFPDGCVHRLPQLRSFKQLNFFDVNMFFAASRPTAEAGVGWHVEVRNFAHDDVQLAFFAFRRCTTSLTFSGSWAGQYSLDVLEDEECVPENIQQLTIVRANVRDAESQFQDESRLGPLLTFIRIRPNARISVV